MFFEITMEFCKESLKYLVHTVSPSSIFWTVGHICAYNFVKQRLFQ